VNGLERQIIPRFWNENTKESRQAGKREGGVRSLGCLKLKAQELTQIIMMPNQVMKMVVGDGGRAKEQIIRGQMIEELEPQGRCRR
jgi:Holliday junction resolvasome RuvABC endonuclease subunit